MKVNWLIISEKALVDQATENPSIINIFTNSKARGLPVIHNFVVTMNITEANDGEKVKVQLLDPDGETVGGEGKEIVITNSEMNIYVNVSNITLNKAGCYTVRVLTKDEELKRTSFILEVQS